MGPSELPAGSQPPSKEKSCPPPAFSGRECTSALGEEHAGLTQSFKNISPPTESLINQASSHPCVTVVAVTFMIVTRGCREGTKGLIQQRGGFTA